MNQASTIIPIDIRKLKRVQMRLPPPHLFDEPLGCPDKKRFFALYWSRADQAPVLNDGFVDYLGKPDPYRIWRYHPAVLATLAKYNIGDAAITADHWLLVDRKARALYVGKVWDVIAVLDSQKSGTPDLQHETEASPHSRDSLDVQLEDALVPRGEHNKPMISNEKLLDELEAWLDAHASVS